MDSLMPLRGASGQMLGEETESQIEIKKRTAANARLPLLSLPRKLRNLIWGLTTSYILYHTCEMSRDPSDENETARLDKPWFPLHANPKYRDPKLTRFSTTGAPPICTQIYREVTELIRMKQRVYLMGRDGRWAVHFANSFLYRMPRAPVENLRWLQIGRLRPPQINDPRMASVSFDGTTVKQYYEAQEKLLAFLSGTRLEYLRVVFDVREIKLEQSRLTARAEWLGPFLDLCKRSASNTHPALEIQFTDLPGYGRAQPDERILGLICDLRKYDGVTCIWR